MNARHCALRYHPHYCCTSRRGYCSAAADIIEISCTPQTAQHLQPTPLLSQPATAVKYPNNLLIPKVFSTHFYTSHVADLPHACTHAHVVCFLQVVFAQAATPRLPPYLVLLATSVPLIGTCCGVLPGQL